MAASTECVHQRKVPSPVQHDSTGSASRKKVLIAHPYVHPVGGGNAVAAWAIQALVRDFDVTLALLGPIDIAGLNRSFGTSLSASDFTVRIAPEKYQRIIRYMPTQGALLESNVTASWARTLDRQEHFSAVLSTQNETDFGRVGAQYIHYPAWYMPRPDVEMKWFHRIPGVLALYRKLCFRCSGTTQAGVRRNMSLANSEFVADRIRDAHGLESRVLPPPVPGEFPQMPWEDRRAAFIAVGRFSGYKRWGMALAIVEGVRAKGFDLDFTLVGQIGHPNDIAEERRLLDLATTRPWFRVLTNLTRGQLMEEVVSHRYGIHTMENEHFGIAVAELQRAGCITFVPDSGGPMEIIGNDPRLIFHDVAGAVAKIAGALGDAATEESLRQLVRSRRDCYSTERFCNGIRDIVSDLAETNAG